MAKDQSKVQWNEDKIQKTESSEKSMNRSRERRELGGSSGGVQSQSGRPVSSLKQTFDRSLVGKSPRSRTTESRYLGTLEILDTKSSGNATFNCETADTIRASIYQVWLEKKKQVVHEEQKKQKLKEQQETERREQEKLESKKEAKVSFEAWKAKKKSVLKESSSKKKEEEKKKQQAEVENEQRKEVAKKAFEKWKEEKDTHQMEKLKKQKEIEKEKKRKEKEHVTEKKTENIAALIKWNSNKKVELKQKMKKNAEEEQKKKTEEEYTKYEREEMASVMYKKWLEQKEKQQRHDKKQRKIRRILQHEFSIFCVIPDPSDLSIREFQMSLRIFSLLSSVTLSNILDSLKSE
ncbi:microtubule-associated protein 9-like isoform X1 [Hemiscyllium ocellatum]|uniref:microtubule-associated protein 9-like isoform X1 n=2 Tax=Hemiscyllium ocellatum TaxID=170820 RepID=UPI0029673AB1|nr:microtubule-associated protein 9-like isoform X1 [Hemiscyllium ocellatum]